MSATGQATLMVVFFFFLFFSFFHSFLPRILAAQAISAVSLRSGRFGVEEEFWSI